jgi:hypothetical protein
MRQRGGGGGVRRPGGGGVRWSGGVGGVRLEVEV